MDVSVVIATYNRRELLATCLRCMDVQDYPHDCFEVIVVDDGSSDGSVEMVRNWSSPYSLCCIEAAHQGSGPARNLGVSCAKGDIIIFIDDDAFAAPWFISEHMRSHRRSTGPLFVDGPAVFVSGQQAIDNPPFFNWKFRLQAFLDFFGLPFVSVNVSCPRADFLRVGGFDPCFGKAYGYEDTELGMRLRLAGLGQTRNRRAYVLHHTNGTPTLESEIKKRRECGGNGALFYAKHPLPEVKKLVKWNCLRWYKFLNQWGLLRWATPELAASLKYRGHLLYPIVRKMLLIRLYATALRSGLAEAGLSGDD